MSGKREQIKSLDQELRRQGQTNVLLSSVGRRSYLVHYFRQVLAGKGLVIATNSLTDSPGMTVADVSCVVPAASDDCFVDELVGVCAQHRVRLLFSLHDWEAPFIASNLEKFRAVGTIPVVSRPEVIDLCLDKLKTQEFTHRQGIAYPLTVSSPEEARRAVLSGSLSVPLVVKPRFGQGSLGVQMVWDEADFGAIHRLLMKSISSVDSNQLLTGAGSDSLIFQEFIKGEEFGLDVVNDLNGKFVVCFVKHKFAMRAGETDIAETVHDQTLEEIGRRIGNALGHVGLLDVDLIVRDGVAYLLEMNPRFGGHYPFSHMAGANIPAALVAWALGVEPDPSWLRIKTGVKCFKDITLVVDKGVKKRGKRVPKVTV
jgi:carbamoyl-phosphate synthase large subunit